MVVVTISERIRRLYETDNYYDVEFVVHCGDQIERIKGHKALFALSSHVFDSMLFGDLAESNEIKIFDIEPDAFRSLKNFIYTDEIEFKSVRHARWVYEIADKYDVEDLLVEAENYLQVNLSPETCFRILEFSRMYLKEDMERNCMDLIKKDTISVLNSEDFLNCDLNFIKMIVNEDQLNIDEIDLFLSIEKWAKNNFDFGDTCAGIDSEFMNEVMNKVRFLTMSLEEFARGPSQSSLLTADERLSLFTHLVLPASVDLPSRFCTEKVSRKTKKPTLMDALHIPVKCPAKIVKNVDNSDLNFSLSQYGQVTIVKWKKQEVSSLELDTLYYSPDFELNGHSFSIYVKPIIWGDRRLWFGLSCRDKKLKCKVNYTVRFLPAEEEEKPWSYTNLCVFGAVHEKWLLGRGWSWLLNEGYIIDDHLEIEMEFDLS